MGKFNVGDRVIINIDDTDDKGKGGIITTVVDRFEIQKYLALAYSKPLENWFDVKLDQANIGLDMSFHESELLPESSLIKDH